MDLNVKERYEEDDPLLSKNELLFGRGKSKKQLKRFGEDWKLIGINDSFGSTVWFGFFFKEYMNFFRNFLIYL